MIQNQVTDNTKNLNSEFRFLGSMLSGLVSRSSQSAKIHRLYRDGKIPKYDFYASIASDSNIIISKQDKFAFVTGGQFDWLDILRPIAECFSGFNRTSSPAFDYKTTDYMNYKKETNSIQNEAIGPVTRWFRTNTFYRKPLVSNKIDCSGEELAVIMP